MTTNNDMPVDPLIESSGVLTKLEAIRAATLNGAQLLEIEYRVATIAPDVLVKKGETVVSNGRMISHSDNPPDGPFPREWPIAAARCARRCAGTMT